jgi:GNAT superfamily N-acetyltransferase
VNGRTATASDLQPVAATLAGAFFDDPVWAWAFPDPARRHEQHAALWGLLLEGAIGYGWVWTTDGFEAATLWIPPDQPELPDAQAERLEPLLDELLGDRAPLVLEVIEQFDSTHPRDAPHYYLSLLGTHPDHRGRGAGMDLLRQNLALIDDLHQPAYLESTNPANLDRYRSLGFERLGDFDLPHSGPAVTQMWRDAR